MKLALSRQRFDDRRNLLDQLGKTRRKLDALAETDGISGLQAQAMELVLKGVANAFDLSQEDPRTIARYDTSKFFNPAHWTAGDGKTKNNIPWYTAPYQDFGKNVAARTTSVPSRVRFCLHS